MSKPLLPLLVLVACAVKEDGDSAAPSTDDSDVTGDTDLPSSPVDGDGDGVFSDADPDDADLHACGDVDGDGCDDCTIRGFSDPSRDGFDHEEDGTCELPIDPDCLHGAGAANDPLRIEACLQLALTNADRILFADESGNAAPIAWSEEAWNVADAHSRDMCVRGFFDHVNPDGDDPTDRARNAGYDFGLAENIAINWDSFATHYAFMAEPTCTGHRGNILTPRATQVGIAVFRCDRGPYQGAMYTTEDYIWDFAIPESAWCATHGCEVPPAPITIAARWCTGGGCPPLPDTLLADWECE